MPRARFVKMVSRIASLITRILHIFIFPFLLTSDRYRYFYFDPLDRPIINREIILLRIQLSQIGGGIRISRKEGESDLFLYTIKIKGKRKKGEGFDSFFPVPFSRFRAPLSVPIILLSTV